MNYLWPLAAVCAFFVKGLCGFANTLVFTTMLSFHADNVSISPVELLLGYPTNAILAWKERKSIRWSICLPLAALVVLGSLPGIFFLKYADTGLIRSLFGVVIMFVGVQMLLAEKNTQQKKQSRVFLAIVGLLSGILCGLYGIGALLGVYVNRVTDDSRSFKANICVVFLVENTLRIFLYAANDILTLAALRQAAMLAPFMLLGLFLGVKSSAVLSEALVKKLVIVMLILSGAALLL